MKKNFPFLIFFLLVIIVAKAQSLPDLSTSKTYKDSVYQFTVYCDKQLNKENYKALIQLSEQGLAIAKADDYSTISLFYFFKAVGFNNNIDSSITYFKISKEAALKVNDTKRILEAEGRLLDAYNSSVKYTNEQNLLAASLEKKITSLKDNNLKQTILSPLANYYNQRGLYVQQINCLLQQIELLKQRQNNQSKNSADSSNIGVALYNIGDVYMSLKNAEKAKYYYQSSRPYFYNYQLGIAYYYKGMSDVSVLENNITQTKPFIDSLQLMAQNGFSDAWSVSSMVLGTIANSCLDNNDLTKAETFLQQAQTNYNKYPDESILPELNYTFGKLYALKGNFKEALPYLEKAEAFKENISIEKKLSLLKILANCYAGLGQWQKAYLYYHEFVPLRDSVYTIASSQSLANAEAEFQTKEKQQQIEAQKLQLSFNKKQKIGLVAGLFLMGVVAVLLIIFYRNKKRTADLLNQQNLQLSALNTALTEANQTKAKLFGILSHDLRSPISQVYQYLRLQQMKEVNIDEEQQIRLNDKIQTAAGSLLETMEDLLLWSKTQMNQFEPKIQTVHLHELITDCINLLQLNIDSKDLTVMNEVQSTQTVMSDTYFLQTIIRNLLQNAIKASPEDGVILISFKESSLYIENNGASFSQADYEKAISNAINNRSLSGLGLKIVTELSEKINAKIHFSSTNTYSTSAQVKFS